ncbi:MAG: DUF1572 family protein [Flavobacteriales bacterium]
MEKHAATLGMVALFEHYKELGEKAVAQVRDEDLHRFLGNDGNSIAVIMRHMAGNMRSRYTDFLESDGEKPWRDREGEFAETTAGRAELLKDWNDGWECFFLAARPLKDEDLRRMVLIRNEEHTVLDALQRQLAHYAYHVGQIILLARAFTGNSWHSLSIPRGGTSAFNRKHGL